MTEPMDEEKLQQLHKAARWSLPGAWPKAVDDLIAALRLAWRERDKWKETARQWGDKLVDTQRSLDTARAEARRYREALPDPSKLRLLADWFDQDDYNKGRPSNDEVQQDLRRWADTAEAALRATAAGEE